MKISQIASVKRGIRVTRSMLSDVGYPVFQNCLTPMGYYEKMNVNANTPYVICGGAAGEVGFSKEAFWAADDCEYLECGTQVLGKYVYHCLMNNKARVWVLYLGTAQLLFFLFLSMPKNDNTLL